MTKNKSVLVAALALIALPILAQAATFAFVNKSGNVSTVIADTPNIALATAFNIDEHSGVILLSTTGDYGIVGNNVSGI